MGLHASRQLSDKVLRYLKRVIVTPAVYRSFVRLYPGFRYRHWAGFSDHTHPFGLAVTYVFVKQSDLPSHCDQTWLARARRRTTAGTAYPEVTPLICRIPSRRLLANTPWASNPGAPVSDLGTVARWRPCTPFHGHSGLVRGQHWTPACPSGDSHRNGSYHPYGGHLA